MKKTLLVLMAVAITMGCFYGFSPQHIVFAGSSVDEVIGTWKPTEYSFAGEKKDQGFLDDTVLVFKTDGTATSTVDGMRQTGTYKITDDTVTFTFKIGPNGIDVVYKIVGDTLKIDNPVTKATYRKIK